MIAYFDTSAIIPLVIHETSTDVCNRVWSESTRVVSVRLLYPEARAALAKAHGMRRLTRTQLTAAVAELDTILAEIDSASSPQSRQLDPSTGLLAPVCSVHRFARIEGRIGANRPSTSGDPRPIYPRARFEPHRTNRTAPHPTAPHRAYVSSSRDDHLARVLVDECGKVITLTGQNHG